MGKSLEDWIAEVETGLDRKLSKNENEFVESLTELLDRFDWKDEFNAKDLSLLNSEILTVERDHQRSLTRDLWDGQPEDEYSLWQYLSLVFDDRDIEIPGFLKAHTNLDETRKRILSR